MKIFGRTLLLVEALLLVACGSVKSSSQASERHEATAIDVGLRTVDSVWSSLTERQTIRIFYLDTNGFFQQDLINMIDNEGGMCQPCPSGCHPMVVEFVSETTASTAATSSSNLSVQSSDSVAEMHTASSSSEPASRPQQRTWPLALCYLLFVTLLSLGVFCLIKKHPIK